MNYTINYTDNTKTPIIVPENTVNDDTLDVVLFGRVDLEYGEQLNENMLQMLERFACPQDSTSPFNNTFPDYTINGDSLKHPTEGQIWFNSTAKLLYTWDETRWVPLRITGSIAGNYGQLLDGSRIPLPVNPTNGYVFSYDECIWAVSPASIPQAFTSLTCNTDNEATVTMQYTVYGGATISGVANYIIMGIPQNINLGTLGA